MQMESQELFHEFLQLVEEKNLNEGEYLKMCKALRDVFNKFKTFEPLISEKPYTIECINHLPFTCVRYTITKWSMMLEYDEDHDYYEKHDITIEYERIFDNGKNQTPTLHTDYNIEKFKDQVRNMCEAIEASTIVLKYDGIEQVESFQSYSNKELAKNKYELAEGLTEKKISPSTFGFYSDMVQRLVSFMKVDGFEEF